MFTMERGLSKDTQRGHLREKKSWEAEKKIHCLSLNCHHRPHSLLQQIIRFATNHTN